LLDGTVLVAGGFDEDQLPLASAEIYDPNAGTFAPTGNMPVARGGHTATPLLPSRMVLFAGGGMDDYAVGAELFDPNSGTFTATGGMTEARLGHTATLLPNGTVLVAGGRDIVGNSLASAELYDPATGTFAPNGSMTAARALYTATLLPNQKVLLAGGEADYTGAALASAELFEE